MAEDKWVRVMADYSSDGLWRRDGAMFSRSDLPVSAGLAARHAAWCAAYEASEFYMPEEEREKEFDLAAFAAEGLAIARAIKAELPDWTLVYYDEAAAQAAIGTDRPRWAYEYAVR
jgi:uncharacterized protein involved in propanediol utilization